MAFDAGLVAALTAELSGQLTDARVEKVQQPNPDEVLLLLHKDRTTLRLLLHAGADSPRACLVLEGRENPAVPPMFCMLLRKHLVGARIAAVRQFGFERVMEWEFDAASELGYACKKSLILEIMGKYSNLILCEFTAQGERRVLGAMKLVDFSTSSKRQILNGISYTLPPAQEKCDPFAETESAFFARVGTSLPTEKWLAATYLGIATFTAREMLYRANGEIAQLWNAFADIRTQIQTHSFTPYLVTDASGAPKEFAFFCPTCMQSTSRLVPYASVSALIEAFYHARAQQDAMRQRSADITHILHTHIHRLQKKLAVQQAERKECDAMEEYRRMGDLTYANLFLLQPKTEEATVTDYTTDPPSEVTLHLNPKLTPAQNAQEYYKRYRKAKNAQIMLDAQIQKATGELQYLQTVLESVPCAEKESDLEEIRRELVLSGYLKKSTLQHAAKNPPPPAPMRFYTDSGKCILCGKNNTQNDYITTKLAQKTDVWFHVKHYPGSHVVLLCEGETPTTQDLTQAAVIAATYSQAASAPRVDVDYTHIRYVKKPNGAPPGYVTFSQNETAYVAPDPALAERLREKNGK